MQAINHESDRGVNYQIGKILEIIAAATAQFDGHHRSPGGLAGIVIGSPSAFSSGFAGTLTLVGGSTSQTGGSLSAMGARQHGDGFRFSGQLDVSAGPKKNAPTGETQPIATRAVLAPSFWDEFKLRW
jgi:hypothetical protein